MNELAPQIVPLPADQPTPVELAATTPLAVIPELSILSSTEPAIQDSFLIKGQVVQPSINEQSFIQQPDAEMSKFQKLKAKFLGKSALSKSVIDVATPYDNGEEKSTMLYISKGTNPSLEKYQNDFALAVSQNAYALKAENPFDAETKFQVPAIESTNDWMEDDEPW